MRVFDNIKRKANNTNNSDLSNVYNQDSELSSGEDLKSIISDFSNIPPDSLKETSESGRTFDEILSSVQKLSIPFEDSNIHTDIASACITLPDVEENGSNSYFSMEINYAAGDFYISLFNTEDVEECIKKNYVGDIRVSSKELFKALHYLTTDNDYRY